MKEQKTISDLISYYEEMSKTCNEHLNVGSNRLLANVIDTFLSQLKQLKEDNPYQNILDEIKQEHTIMKQILIENGLWETLLNDDRFNEYLRS